MSWLFPGAAVWHTELQPALFMLIIHIIHYLTLDFLETVFHKQDYSAAFWKMNTVHRNQAMRCHMTARPQAILQTVQRPRSKCEWRHYLDKQFARVE
jgi:hypothetical protein